MKTTYPYYLANQAEAPNQDIAVTNKYTGEVVTHVAQADASVIDQAITAAVASAPALRKLAPFERQAILRHCIRRFHERTDEMADILCIEAGKPIKDARGEVSRLIDTFEIAADEAVRSTGESLNLEISPRSKGYRGFTQRVPIGPCSFITPFNFPLNLIAHKIAPAIAAGCPFVLKPDSRTPVSAIILGEILAETDLPVGSFSILPCEVSEADAFTTDDRFKLLSFTGSPKVGWKLKERAGKKKVVLELGGNAACVVDQGANIEDAVSRIVTGAFYQSGQSCISVQRIIVHKAERDHFIDALTQATLNLKVGDPSDEDVFIGPMISEDEAKRLETWIQDAVSAGARIICGGDRSGAMLNPTLLTDVPRDARLYRQEAFGPVALIEYVENFDDAIERVNDSNFGIHAGVFTPRIDHAFKAWDEIEAGGVLINEMPSWRVDNLPYGGIKDSGLGREGVRYAMEDMTEIRALVIRDGV
ncbi:MAG: aldehyde dehydrogenase family protein [Gammaproteobacteria bacterium]